MLKNGCIRWLIIISILLLSGCQTRARVVATPTINLNTFPTRALLPTTVPTARLAVASTPENTPSLKPTPTLIPLPTPNPASGPLQIVGQIGGPTEAVAVAGNFAYVGVGSRLTVVDVSLQASLHEVGSSEPFGASVRDVQIFGNTAFVAAGGAGMYILDISDPVHPTTIGNYKSSGFTESMTIEGKYAYIADGPDGLRIVNITARTNPFEVSSVYPLGYAFDVVADGNYAYIAAAGAGLLVADLSDPTHPKSISSYGLPGYAYGITKSGSTLYIADGWEGLQVLDVSDPMKPQSIGSYNTPGWAMDVAAVGNSVYLADASGGLRVFDDSDKSKITETGNFPTPDGHSGHLAVSGYTVYVADTHLGVHIVDISVPSTPRSVGLYSPMGYAQAVAVANGYAYIAALDYGFRVIDLADLTHPNEVATLATDLPLKTVAVSGTTVYVGTNFDKKSKQPPSLYAVDISDPLHPKASLPQALVGHTGITTFQSEANSSGDVVYVNTINMFIQGGILYDGAEWGLLSLDISAPLAPHELSFLQTTEDPGASGATAGGVAVTGDVAYLAVSEAGLYTIDVSNPKQPALLGVYNEQPPGQKNSQGDKVSDVVVAPPYAYILYSDFVRALDISDPKHPKGLGLFPVPLSTFNQPYSARSLAIDGNRLFIADSTAGLLELDVTDPAHLKLIGQLHLPGLASWVVVDKGYVYVADEVGGLFIIQAVQESSATNSGPVAHHESLTNAQYGVPPFESFPQTGSLMPILDEIAIPDQSTTGQYQSVSFLRPASPINVPAIPQSSTGNTCTVTSTEDSGPDTLYACLQKARTGDTINFDPKIFPPKNPATIYVATALLMGGDGGITIDGSDAGVILDGSHAPKGTYGFNILSDNNVIKGLQILNFPGGGLALSGDHNVIGGDRSRGEAPLGEGNVISNIGTKLASNNLIIGNYIGVDVSGKKRLGKPGDGSSNWSIGIVGTSSHNRIEGNVIAGTIGIGDAGSSYNEIIGNYIGTDASGTTPLGDDSVIIVGLPFNRIGGTRPGEGNVINGRISIGITSDVIVVGNSIGVDATGKKAFPLSTWMVSLGGGANHNFIGGMTEAERNVIAGGKDSVLIHLGSIANYNFIAGNYLGTDSSSSVVFPNLAGISLEMAEHNAIQGNLIAGSQAYGMSLSSLDPNQAGTDFNRVRVNRITENKVGLAIGNGASNMIVGNSFIGNGINAQDGGQNNQWDDGIEGNYWSDYKGEDKNGDDVGDTPYNVLSNGIDRYPLMKPFLGS